MFCFGPIQNCCSLSWTWTKLNKNLPYCWFHCGEINWANLVKESRKHMKYSIPNKIQVITLSFITWVYGMVFWEVSSDNKGTQTLPPGSENSVKVLSFMFFSIAFRCSSDSSFRLFIETLVVRPISLASSALFACSHLLRKNIIGCYTLQNKQTVC